MVDWVPWIKVQRKRVFDAFWRMSTKVDQRVIMLRTDEHAPTPFAVGIGGPGLVGQVSMIETSGLIAYV
jgi:hypothetical protein